MLPAAQRVLFRTRTALRSRVVGERPAWISYARPRLSYFPERGPNGDPRTEYRVWVLQNDVFGLPVGAEFAESRAPRIRYTPGSERVDRRAPSAMIDALWHRRFLKDRA